MLTKRVTTRGHSTVQFTTDDNGRVQGECMAWRWTGTLRYHCLYKDDKRHGECKDWSADWAILRPYHTFYSNGKDVTAGVQALVVDVKSMTSEEKMVIKLKYDIDTLPRVRMRVNRAIILLCYAAIGCTIVAELIGIIMLS